MKSIMERNQPMKRIAFLTSGGDAPGMNAAIRAIVRVAHHRGFKTFGVMRGYQGLIRNEFVALGPRDVSNIIQKGGTVLKTSRCKEFRTSGGIKKAKSNLEKSQIDALIVIGGDGTYRGAYALSKKWHGKIVGIPGTIDNDLFGTDFTIGYDTAVNTALQAIDKIRDTAESHERVFLVEVMGRDAGFIALDAAISGGAEDILVPEMKNSIRAVCNRLRSGEKKGKNSSIIIVAEGGHEGGAFKIAQRLKAMNGDEYRIVVLGHLQRGGVPTAADRVLASELGAFAVEKVLEGKTGVAVGKVMGEMVMVPFPETWRRKKKLNPFLLKILPILAT